MYEEAIRMSLKIRRPEYIQEAPVNNDMVVNIDFAPTIIDMAGLNPPEEMQGTSLVPLLKGNTPKNWQTEVYYHYWQHRMHRNVTAHYGIRTKNRKLIFFYGHPLDFEELERYEPVEPEWELFDLEKDPGEMNNVYTHPEYAKDVNQLKPKLSGLNEVKKRFT